MKDFLVDPFKKFDKEWALVCAGTKQDFNAMTISWGSFGTLWGKSVVSIYVRPQRHTLKFLKQEDFFSVSFYDEKFRKELSVFGTKSGADCDKPKLTGFRPKFFNNFVTFEQAKQTIVCKKLYCAQLDKTKVDASVKQFYNDLEDDAHFLIVGEVVDIL